MDTSAIIKNLKKYNPEKIILFGSWAWGKPKPDSDVDLLIVKETKKNPYKRIPEARRFLRPIDSPVDVLVFTPREIEERLKEGDSFISDIFKRGKILYET
jgi:predicted nucleotidyltransferase